VTTTVKVDNLKMVGRTVDYPPLFKGDIVAILITETNVRLTVPKVPNRPFSMDELKELLGGPPEVIYLVTTKQRSMCMVVNAEARIVSIIATNDAKVINILNPFATEIYHMFYNTPQYIIGKALLCKVPEEMD